MARETSIPFDDPFAKHLGHANHLCEMVRRREMAKVAGLSRNARYICHICGRVANKSSNLCEPVQIPQKD